MDALEEWRKAGYWVVMSGCPEPGYGGTAWVCSVYHPLGPGNIVTVGGDDREQVARVTHEEALKRWPSALPLEEVDRTDEDAQVSGH